MAMWLQEDSFFEKQTLNFDDFLEDHLDGGIIKYSMDDMNAFPFDDVGVE